MSVTINGLPLKAEDSDLQVMRTSMLVRRLRNFLPITWLAGRFRRQIAAPPVAPQEIGSRRIRIVLRHVHYSADAMRFPPKQRPKGFSYQTCFENLVATIAASPVGGCASIHMYYNGTADELAADPIMTTLENVAGDVEVRLIAAGSALEAYLIMLRAVRDSAFGGGDIIYLLENDYLHHPDWIAEVLELYRSGVRFDFASLYDHPDRYKVPRRYEQSRLVVTATRHWVTAPSTCASFILTRDQFMRDFEEFYSHRVDHRIFTRLVKGKERVLLTPVPGLATHCMVDHLDRLNRFEDVFRRVQCRDR